MKALMLETIEKLYMKEVPVPSIEVGEALIRVEAVSVCGSDIHSYHGANALFQYPGIMGHEMCGEVVECNGSGEFAVGDRVILLPYINCGTCIACRKGKTNCCTTLSVYGVHRQGAMAEYIKAPFTHIIKIPKEMPKERAAVIEPFAISAHAVRRVDLKAGEVILVAGAGPIGLGAAEIAKTYGATVLIADTDEKRRAFVQERFDYAHILNPMDADYKEQLLELTNGDLPDKIIDSTGNAISMTNNIKHLSHGGRMVYVGIWGGDLTFKHLDFHKPEMELLGSRGATKEDFEYVVSCINAGKISPEMFITHTADFANAKEAFEEWMVLKGEVFKALIVL